jgi:hypothetical protein
MRRELSRWLAAVALLGAWSAPAFAHHAFAMFDMGKNIAVKGEVVEYRWGNPHVHLTVKVDPAPGVDAALVGLWDFECAGGTVILGRQGWTKSTLKAGDPIDAVVHPLRDGNKGGSLFYITKADGSRMYTDIARPKVE